MKNYILYSLTTLTLSFCDPVFRIKTNGERKTVIHTDCGTIEMSVKSSAGFYNYWIKFKVIDGEYALNIGDLQRNIRSSNSELKHFDFKYNFPETSNLQTVKKEAELEISFAAYRYGDTPERPLILIYPGDYLKCQGRQVLRDTLKIGL